MSKIIFFSFILLAPLSAFADSVEGQYQLFGLECNDGKIEPAMEEAEFNITTLTQGIITIDSHVRDCDLHATGHYVVEDDNITADNVIQTGSCAPVNWKVTSTKFKRVKRGTGEVDLVFERGAPCTDGYLGHTIYRRISGE
jgi:hypothetical protein